ncbi:hypothetical protein ACFE04_000758 [Oxalis oulophora]
MKTLTQNHLSTSFTLPKPKRSLCESSSLRLSSRLLHYNHLKPKLTVSCNRRILLVAKCINTHQELIDDDEEEEEEEDDDIEIMNDEMELVDQSIWNQLKEIVMFTGPATGLWLCGPLMSLIDTAVIGQQSSVQLAALGPGTVLCDYIGYVFMFLSIATSNLVATALARQDKKQVQHQISIMLFVGLACGIFMLLFTRFFASSALTAFTGINNAHIVPAANTYVQIRGYAWPAVLVGWVAQSARYLSKPGVVAAVMMINSLNKKGYSAFSISVPSPSEISTILGLAAPVFITMMAKVAFYSLLIYFATSLGTHTVAAHQVLLQTYSMSTVWGEPLSQTAQSFMPELLYGAQRNLSKARMLLKSLVIIGGTLGVVLGTVGTSVPWFFPNLFTHDQTVIQEMHKVLIPYYLALAVTPSTHSLEGTLMAGRDLNFLSLSMSGCFSMGALVLLFLNSSGYGLLGCWLALVGFQWSRFFLALSRLLSRDGVLYSEDLSRYKMEKLEATN